MTVATRANERRGLAPVQRRVENHIGISYTFDQAHRDSRVKLTLLDAEARIDSFADIRRRALVNDVYESLAIMETYSDEDGSRAAFENLSACVRAYMSFENQDEQHEDQNRSALSTAEARTRRTMATARMWSRSITPECTGEQPDPAA